MSLNEHNVNLVCSNGFYSLVALPAFAHLNPGFSVYLDSLVLICYDMNNKVDSSNAIVNNVFFFRIESHSKTMLGKVTVHLHHTARKVQIQGGSIVNNKKRACVWFLENYIIGHFRITSKEKAVDISNFNSAVQKLAADHSIKVANLEKCADCSVPLGNRSNKVVCEICRGNFHKACLNRATHLCNGAGPSRLRHTDHIPNNLPPTASKAITNSAIIHISPSASSELLIDDHSHPQISSNPALINCDD